MIFLDSAQPSRVPTGSNAAVYVNGYKWSAADVHRMARVFRVSVDREASWARLARCIDIEAGAAHPEDAVPFVLERRRLGFDDATCYVNRSNWPTVRAAFHAAQVPEPLWWVATLDGTWQIPGAWAVQGGQGGGGAWDVSILHGVDNLHTP